MKIMRVVFALLMGALGLARAARGQTTAATNELAAARRPYDAAFAAHSLLLNGPEYLDYTKRYHASTGHQYFFSSEKQPGTLTYNNRLFTDLRLAYDVVLDQVVLSPANSPLTLRLINEKVSGFTLNEHRFVRLVADSAAGSVIRTGFYELLVDGGGVQLLAKRAKNIQERIAQPYINVEFSDVDKLYLYRAGQYHAVASKRSVLRLLADRGKELQRFSQDQKLKFNAARRELSIALLVAHYAGLPPAGAR